MCPQLIKQFLERVGLIWDSHILSMADAWVQLQVLIGRTWLTQDLKRKVCSDNCERQNRIRWAKFGQISDPEPWVAISRRRSVKAYIPFLSRAVIKGLNPSLNDLMLWPLFLHHVVMDVFDAQEISERLNGIQNAFAKTGRADMN
jgi:hypothetical protein